MQQQSARRASSVATFLQPAQVAAILQVSPKTVARWGKQGRLPKQHPLDGHRHYPITVVERFAASLVQEVRAA
jgi:predicted site-specific integrase-resolvase